MLTVEASWPENAVRPHRRGDARAAKELSKEWEEAMTEEEFMQLLARQVQREVERQLAPIMTQVQQLLKSLQKPDDQKKQEDLRHLQRETMLWEFEDLRRLAGLD